MRVHRETGVLEHLTVENELEHVGVGRWKDSMEKEEDEDFHSHGKNTRRRRRLSVWFHNYMYAMINSDEHKMSIKD